jgi:hypothetical protein
MTRVINFPTNLKKKLEDIKKNGGMWEIGKGKFAIKHFEIERLAYEFGITTDIDLKSCDITKGCAVVKGLAIYNNKRFSSLGECSPLNNDFPYPVSVAEKRAVDRAVLKALNIHGQVYSAEELPPENKLNTKVKLNQAEIILERIQNSSQQANLRELMSDNKEYLTQLKKTNSAKAMEIVVAFKNKQKQLIGG